MLKLCSTSTGACGVLLRVELSCLAMLQYMFILCSTSTSTCGVMQRIALYARARFEQMTTAFSITADLCRTHLPCVALRFTESAAAARSQGAACSVQWCQHTAGH
jgi:hypothetical protein